MLKKKLLNPVLRNTLQSSEVGYRKY